jgi:hypothetical protein
MGVDLKVNPLNGADIFNSAPGIGGDHPSVKTLPMVQQGQREVESVTGNQFSVSTHNHVNSPSTFQSCNGL